MTADAVFRAVHLLAGFGLLLALLAGAPAAAQGYAGLGAEGSAEGFREVRPGRAFRFPEDHAPHPGFRIEWWYVTANLEDAEGRPLGVQWTLFRQSLSPAPEIEGWTAPQVWMGHAAVTTPEAHAVAERFARGGVGQAGVVGAPFEAWIDDWRFASLGAGPEAPFAPLALTAAGEGFGFDLRVARAGPFALQGEGGYSRKSERGQASYYYSNPFLEVEGRVTLGGETREVTGRAWLDREWSSRPLDADQSGWDWFSLHLPGGEKLMLYRLRHEDGRDWRASNWIRADGTSEALAREGIEMRPLRREAIAGREVPVAWEIAIPARGLEIRTEPVNPRAWMETTFEYWEGPIRFSGTHEGVGYLEMTGW